MTAPRKPDRRRALGMIAGFGGVAGGVAIVVPAVDFLVAPAKGGAGGGRWIRTVPIDSLRESDPKRVTLVADHRDAWTLEKDEELGAAWLLREGDRVKAWTTTCPHLGCAVNRAATSAGFECPCHDSAFAPDGRRLHGPSPRDLDPLETRVEDGVVVIEFRRFRQGTRDREPVG